MGTAVELDGFVQVVSALPLGWCSGVVALYCSRSLWQIEAKTCGESKIHKRFSSLDMQVLYCPHTFAIQRGLSFMFFA